MRARTRAVMGRLGRVVLAASAATALGVAGLSGVAGAESVGISGTPQVFDTLTAAPVSATSPTYAWYTCASSGTIGSGSGASAPSTSTCTNDADTSTTYAVAQSDYQNYVSVIMTDGSTSYWATTSQVQEPAPSVVSNPTLSVSVTSNNNVVGESAVLTGTAFNPVANQTGTSYQWYRCSASAQIPTSTTLASGCNSISGATSSQYVFTTYDYGYWVLAQETATNAAGSATVYSASTTAAIGGTAPTNPTGQALGAMGSLSVALSNFGSWTANPAPTSYTVTWYRCNMTSTSSAGTTLPSGCSSIASGTTYPASTTPSTVVYTYASSDIGDFLLAGIQAYNGLTTNVTGYTASTTAKVVAVAPSMTTTPVMTGTAAVGDTLTVTAGMWSGLPTPSISFAWWLCSSNPSQTSGFSQVGASEPSAMSSAGCTSSGTSTTSSYAPTTVGDYVIAQVIATNSANVESYFTAQAGPLSSASFGTGTVTIAAGNNGSYTSSVSFTGGTTQPTLAYIWEDCTGTVSQQTSPQSSNTTGCSTATGLTAAASTYATVSADMSKNLDLVVKATIGTASTYVWSATSSALTSTAPTGSVSISGSGLLSTAESANATVTAWPAANLSYQWYDCPSTATSAANCTIITGATGASYTPSTLAEASLNGGNDHLGVLLTAANLVSPNGTAFALSASALTTQVPAIITYPTITVTPSATAVTTASTLTSSPGTWQGAPTPSLTYQWYACTGIVSSTSTSLAGGCSVVPGATGSTYTPTGGYVNDYFLVGVTGSNGVTIGGASTAITAYSSSTVYALVSTLSITSLTVTGTPTVGSTLSATALVNAQGAYTSAYQWYECTATVTAGTSVPATCTVIAGATAASFLVTSNQASYYLTVADTVTGSGTTATGVAATTALVTSSIPGSPTHVTAVAGPGQATVSWIAPTSGLAVTSYKAVASNGASCTATVPTCVVTGLFYGTTYTFTVTATNSYGTSPASAVSNAIMPTETAPAAPTHVVATAGSQSAKISWTAALANGAAITQYTATLSPGGFTCVTATLSCEVTGLTNGTTYVATVNARNVVGVGPASVAVTVTPKLLAPNPPVNILIRRLSGALAVHWSASFANGATITGYVVTATGGGMTRTCTTTGLGCVVRGLVNGIAYQVSVVAQSVGGSSVPAVVRAHIAPAGRPTPPMIFRTARGRGVAIVFFRPPARTNGAPVAYYQYFLLGRWTVQPFKGRLVIVLRGLRQHAVYILRVRAVTVGGASAPSNVVRIVTL